MHASRRSQAGFTLLELTAAIFVMSVGLFGVVQMFNVGIDKMRYIEEKDLAVRAVQNEIETLRALPRAALAIGEDRPFVSRTPEMERLVDARGSVTVRNRTDAPEALLEVTVRVSWLGEKGRRIEKSATTLLRKGG